MKLRYIAIFVGMMAWASIASAHPGQLSSKDNCHNDRKADERHWHLPETFERGGVCVDGKQLGNCSVLKTLYLDERGDRYGSWKEEGLAARKLIDCLLEE